MTPDKKNKLDRGLRPPAHSETGHELTRGAQLIETLDLSARYFAQTMKVKLAYRWDFFFQTLGTLMYGVVNVGVIAALLTQVDAIVGWSLWEVVLIYGCGELTFGLFAIACFNAVQLLPSRYIIEGHLDRVLLRPMSSYLQVLLENLSTNDVVILFKGIALITVATTQIDGFHWTALNLLGGGLLILAGATIYAALFTATACLSFRFKDRYGFFNPLFALNDQSRYPFTIYPIGVRLFFSIVLPYAFVAFYPASFILHKEGLWAIAPLGLLVAAAFTALAAWMWRSGLARYESTGT